MFRYECAYFDGCMLKIHCAMTLRSNPFFELLSGLGCHTSNLTPYLKSSGLFTPSVKFSSNSVQPTQRYCDIQALSRTRAQLSPASVRIVSIRNFSYT